MHTKKSCICDLVHLKLDSSGLFVNILKESRTKQKSGITSHGAYVGTIFEWRKVMCQPPAPNVFHFQWVTVDSRTSLQEVVSRCWLAGWLYVSARTLYNGDSA